MNATVSKMLNAYGQTQVSSGVESASPHKLISMLYDGALVAIANARLSLANGDIPSRGAAISKAIAIIEEGLKISIDLEAGGELAQNLRALYDYMAHRLLVANLKSDMAALDEVERLLRELKSAWDQIGNVNPLQPAAAQQAEPPRAVSSYGRV